MLGTGGKAPIGRGKIAIGTGAPGKASSYRCNTCGMAFNSKQELEAHNRKTHGGKK